LRTIIFELTLAPRAEKFITAAFVLFGVILFIYGTSAAITAYRLDF
jgi:hypothetical protein